MGEQRLTAQQRWVLGLTATASFIAVLDEMVVTTALDSRPRKAAGTQANFIVHQRRR
jgi:hypothetical protein